MTIAENKKVEAIKAQYIPTEKTKLDDLKALDKKVKRPAHIFAYTFGGAGTLVLGAGMCLAMGIIGSSIPLGIGVGLVGIAMVSVNYFIHKKILKSRKNKYVQQIIELSNELLNK